MPDKLDNDTKEIINSFVSEGYERLEDAEIKMQYIEGENYQEIVNTIFRLFHSIKGSAGYLNFDNIKSVTHEAETLLDIFRKSDRKPDQNEIDLLYQTLDLLKQLIQNVEKAFTDKGFEKDTEVMVHTLSKSIENVRKDLDKSGAAKQEKAGRKNAEKKMDQAIDNLITPDMVEKFISESTDLLDKSEKEALDLENNPDNSGIIQSLFRDIHTIKGNAGFFAFAEIEKKSMDLESILDSVRKGRMKINNNSVTVILKQIDDIRGNVLSLQADGGKSAAKQPEPVSDKNIYKPLGEILVDLGEASRDAVDKALTDQSKPIGEILVESGEVTKEAVEKALEIQQKAVAAGAVPSAEVQRKEIRVDTAKLDKLFDLVGELITAEALVFNNPDILGLKLDNFNKSCAALGKISREIQEITMMVRMVPLEGLFTKMIRLVRDLSRKSGKKIGFQISGQETEMDKNVIEQISDPLVHIIRNAIDHGIEEPEKRLKAGKAEEGSIRLDARYEGNEIWISIRDDGAGLDRDKILKKAVERGIFAGDAGHLTDRQVWDFIFEAGFSTADKVTEVSGRGVGMDVVKKNIERIRGKVEINSEKGNGTEMVLQIPLTMAILDGITIRTGRNFYSIPLTDIIEFFKIKKEQVTLAENGNEVVNLRGSIMPLLRLHEIFGISGAITEATEGVTIVLHAGDKKACLLIDEVIGNQQIVIKSISDHLGNVEGVSGCSILGDGSVSLIIDSARLIAKRID